MLNLGDCKSTADRNVYLQTLASAPTSNRRRIQQSMNLAQKLSAKQRELEAAQT